MKTSNITKSKTAITRRLKHHGRAVKQWAALLLTVSGMAALPWNDACAAAGENKLINTATTVIESGSSYRSNGTTNSALQVTGSGAVYIGTNITLTGTGMDSNPGYRAMIVQAGGTVRITGGTISSQRAAGDGSVFIGGTSSVVELTNVTATANTYNFRIQDGAVFRAADSYLASSGGMVVHIFVSSTAWVTGGTIAGTSSTGNHNYGVAAEAAGAAAILNGVTINTTSAGGMGLVAANGGYAEVNDCTFNTSGLNTGLASVLVYSGGTVAINNTEINSNGLGVFVNNSEVTVNSSEIHSTGSSAVLDVGGDSKLTLNGGKASSAGGGNLLSVSGTGHSEIILNSVDSSGADGINSTTNGTATVNISGGSGIKGDVTNSGSGVLTVSFNNSNLTGSGTVSSDGVLTVNVDNNSTWDMTSNSTVTNLALNGGGKVVFQTTGGYKTLTVANLSGSGEFHMNTNLEANTGDLLDITGTSAGAHQVRIINHGNNTAGTEPALLMVRTADGQATFSGTVSVGMFDYSLYQDGTNWYLAASGTNLPPAPPAPQPGDVGKDILVNTPGAQAPGWFDHNNNIGGHLTDLRTNDRNMTVKSGASDKDVTLSAASILNSVWLKAYGAQMNISGKVAGVGVREMDYGTDIGADHQWSLDNNNTLIAGAFVGYGRTDRETRNNFGSEGNTDAFRLGLYGVWLSDSGWFADIIAKGQYNDNTISAYDASYNKTTADFDNWGGGISADLGKRFDFEHGWFIEPSVLAAYAHLTGSDYTTAGGDIFSVSTTDADVFQFKVGIAFGRTIKLTNSGILQPYIKVAGVEQISTGGKVKASGSEWRPTMDGARAELGGGIIWQLNVDHQLSLDYEASFGDKYDKPWGLTAGYRYQF